MSEFKKVLDYELFNKKFFNLVSLSLQLGVNSLKFRGSFGSDMQKVYFNKHHDDSSAIKSIIVEVDNDDFCLIRDVLVSDYLPRDIVEVNFESCIFVLRRNNYEDIIVNMSVGNFYEIGDDLYFDVDFDFDHNKTELPPDSFIYIDEM